MSGKLDPSGIDDAPELTAEQLAEMRPAREVLSPEQFAAVTGRGRPKSETKKVPVTIRLDPHVLETFKADGPGWQTRMQQVLAKSLKGRSKAVAVRSLAASAVSGKSGGYEAIGPKGRTKAARSSGGKKQA